MLSALAGGDRNAHLGRDERCDLGEHRFEHLEHAVEDFGPPARAEKLPRPLVGHSPRRPDRPVDVVFRRERRPADPLFCRGADDVNAFAGRHPLTG